jgi:stage III sporulation protein SpoIIIAA
MGQTNGKRTRLLDPTMSKKGLVRVIESHLRELVII